MQHMIIEPYRTIAVLIPRLRRFLYTPFSVYPITCSAVALSSVQDGLGSLWQHGNSKTSQLRNLSSYNELCTFDYVRENKTCAKYGWNPPARGRSTHTWNIHFLWLVFLPFLPLLLFFSCAPAQAKRIEQISRTMDQLSVHVNSFIT